MQRCDFAKWLTCGTQLRWSPANSCTKRIGVPEPDSSQCKPTPSEAVARGTMDSMLEWSRAAWRRHLPNVPDINSFVRELGDGTIPEPALVLREIGRPDAEPQPWNERAAPDSLALLAFTSGTTGKPKGVPLTHRNLLTSIRAAMAAWRWKRYDVLVHALPLFHQHGLGGFHATLIAGSSLHLLPRFDPEELLRAAEKATVLFAVPTMYQRLEGTAES